MSVAVITDSFTKTELAILLKYGVTLNHVDVADFFKKTPGTLYQRTHNETFPIKPVKIKMDAKEKRGTKLYDFRDVAKYWDQAHEPEDCLKVVNA